MTRIYINTRNKLHDGSYIIFMSERLLNFILQQSSKGRWEIVYYPTNVWRPDIGDYLIKAVAPSIKTVIVVKQKYHIKLTYHADKWEYK